MALDPLAREVVRNGEDEDVVVERLTLCIPEPGAVRVVVQRPLQAPSYLVHRVSALSSRLFHPAFELLPSRRVGEARVYQWGVVLTNDRLGKT